MRSKLVKTILGVTVLGIGLTRGAFAEGPNAAGPVGKPQAAPATQPVPANIAALITQLGDERYAKREEAVTELKKLGNQALPALTQASSDANPQIRTSAQSLVSQIRGENKPEPPAQQDGIDGNIIQLQGGMLLFQAGGNLQIHNMRVGGNGMARMQVNMNINGQSTRDTTVEQNGQKVHIHEDTDGIKMEVTEKGETKETKAKDADDLKKNNPDAFKVYEQYSGKGNGEIRIDPPGR